MRGHESERGATLVEYALLVALVAVVAIPAIGWLTSGAEDVFDRTVVSISGSPAGPEPPSPPPTPPGPTSTTSPPPSSTTAPSTVASAVFADARSWSAGWYRWSGSADVVITDATGHPLPGAEVEVRVTTSTGSVRTVTVTTDATGRATVEVGPYDWFGSWGGTGRVDLKVIDVETDGGSWDGDSPTTTLRPP